MMAQAFYTGLSGVRSSSSGIDVLSDNLSNISTVGFRGYQTEFSSLFESQVTSTSASSPTNNSVGVGSKVSAISMDNSQGELKLTSRTTDLAILGDGWFGLQGNGQTVYTRDGTFEFDANRDLVAPDGYYVLGTIGNNIKDGVLTEQLFEIPLTAPGAQEKLTFPKELYFPAQATTEVEFTGNLTSNYEKDPLDLQIDVSAGESIVSSSATAGDVVATTSATDPDGGTITYDIDNKVHYAIDSATGEVTLTSAGADALNAGNDLPSFILSADSTSGWESSEIYPNDKNPQVMAVSSTVYTADGVRNKLRLQFTQSDPQVPPGVQWDVVATVSNLDGTQEYAKETGLMSFDETGKLTSATLSSIDNQGTSVAISYGKDYTGLVSMNKGSALNSKADGKESGVLLGYDINKNGKVLATFSNGEQSHVGAIAVYHFANDAGLHRANGSRFLTSPNSGEPLFFTDRNGNYVLGTDLINEKLEVSNVRIEAGLTELIIMQRSYDSNAKVISTADQMLQKALSMDA